MKKKPVIKDWHGTRVLIETIAAYKDVDRRVIKVSLRSGERMNLAWETCENKRKVLKALDAHFDILT